MTRRILTATFSALALIGITTAMAQYGGGSRGGPPAEAYIACDDQRIGQSCSFRTPRGQMNGTCGAPRGAVQLVCMPDSGQNARNGDGRRGGPSSRGGRAHDVTQLTEPVDLEPAAFPPVTNSIANIYAAGAWRYIEANGIPDHLTGEFPNAGNPNRIRPQSYTYRVPVEPRQGEPKPLTRGQVFGVAVNGVPFDPGAAEFYGGDPGSGWQYEALSGAIALGLDENFAHVQPQGAYHYHGLPTRLMNDLAITFERHSPIIGWAADGFPIYALYGYADADDPASGIVRLKPGYQVKMGSRPFGPRDPGGYFDGTFTADYEFKDDLGDLDQCNGRFAKTPDFPNGTYAYFLTTSWPVVPRCFVGTPSAAFTHKRGPR